MITLTYTDQMVEQDLLWIICQENLETMKELFAQLYLEAWSKGFEGYVHVYDGDNESIAAVYASTAEYERDCLGKFDNDGDVGYCRPLIDRLEKKLNGKE